MNPPTPAGPGSHIRIMSPGMPTLMHVPERGERAEAPLCGLGFEVSYGRHAFVFFPYDQALHSLHLLDGLRARFQG